jgi:LacI family transcriptional regulator
VVRHDMHLTLTELPDSNLTDEKFIPKILRESMSDGLIVHYFQDAPEQMLELIQRHHLPAVWTNVRRATDSVCPDDLQGGRLAAEHLLRLGHRRIAYVDSVHNFNPRSERQDHYSAAERFEGYSSAMRAAGLEPRLLSKRMNLPASAVTEFASSWLSSDDRPTAVVTYSPREAQGVVLAAARLGISIPRDLSIVTFEGQPVDIGVPITTALLPEREVGREAVRMLLEKIAEPERSFPSRALKIVLGPEQSSAPPK